MECEWVDVCSKWCFVSTWINFQENPAPLCHREIFLFWKVNFYIFHFISRYSSTKPGHNIKFRFLLLSAPFACSECHRNFYHLNTVFFCLLTQQSLMNGVDDCLHTFSRLLLPIVSDDCGNFLRDSWRVISRVGRAAISREWKMLNWLFIEMWFVSNLGHMAMFYGRT